MIDTSRTAVRALTVVLVLGFPEVSALAGQETASSPETENAQTPQPPAQQRTRGELPAGHPMMSTPPSAMDALPPVAEGSGTGAAALAWTAPADWVSEPPANAMRRAQYRVPGPGGDAECIVFYFGPGQGGEPMDNAERWAGQFADADGRPATASMKTRSEKVGDVSVLFVEAAGTYHGGSMMGMRKSAPRPDWALLGAVAEGADANWFFKLTGPKATVEAEREAFEAMLRSLRRGE